MRKSCPSLKRLLPQESQFTLAPSLPIHVMCPPDNLQVHLHDCELCGLFSSCTDHDLVCSMYLISEGPHRRTKQSLLQNRSQHLPVYRPNGQMPLIRLASRVYAPATLVNDFVRDCFARRALLPLPSSPLAIMWHCGSTGCRSTLSKACKSTGP